MDRDLMSLLSAEALVVLGRGPYSLSVEAGECVSIRGPSGAGKTLFLRALADLDRHDGTVKLDGVEAREMSGPEWRRQVGLLFAESAWWTERVRDHFGAGSNHDATFETLGLPAGAMDFEVSRLSTGEKQRLAIARLLHVGARVLLLDEPTASLDEANVARVEGSIRAYREARQAAVVWVTHDPRQSSRVASRSFVLSANGLQQDGDERSVRLAEV